jgi:hypothetical protein
MSNASRCREIATRFGELAALSDNAEERGSCLKLERLWLEMAALAARFDRKHDGESKAEIYAMMEEVEQVRHKVA